MIHPNQISLWKLGTLHILDIDGISGSVSLKFRGNIGGSPTQLNLLQPWLHKRRYRERSCQSQCRSCSLIDLFQLGLTRLYKPLSNSEPWTNRLNFREFPTDVLPNKWNSWPLAKWDMICKSHNFLQSETSMWWLILRSKYATDNESWLSTSTHNQHPPVEVASISNLRFKGVCVTSCNIILQPKCHLSSGRMVLFLAQNG